MLDGRIEMSEEEAAAVDSLAEEHGRGAVSRRDPGEKGPLLFKHRDGRVWEIEGSAIRRMKGASRG